MWNWICFSPFLIFWILHDFICTVILSKNNILNSLFWSIDSMLDKSDWIWLKIITDSFKQVNKHSVPKNNVLIPPISLKTEFHIRRRGKWSRKKKCKLFKAIAMKFWLHCVNLVEPRIASNRVLSDSSVGYANGSISQQQRVASLNLM